MLKDASKCLTNIGSFWETEVEKMEADREWEIEDAILGRKLGKSKKERERFNHVSVRPTLQWKARLKARLSGVEPETNILSFLSSPKEYPFLEFLHTDKPEEVRKAPEPKLEKNDAEGIYVEGDAKSGVGFTIMSARVAVNV
jgi:hypothetical protein